MSPDQRPAPVMSWRGILWGVGYSLTIWGLFIIFPG